MLATTSDKDVCSTPKGFGAAARSPPHFGLAIPLRTSKKQDHYSSSVPPMAQQGPGM